MMELQYSALSVMNAYHFAKIMIVMIGFQVKITSADELPTCTPADFHYEFTECEAGGRWRVSVPKPNSCIAGAPNPPTRVEGCSTSCEPGQFFNVSSTKCEKCGAGNYSLGGGVMFDSWKTLPPGFQVQHEPFIQSSFREYSGKNKNINKNLDCASFGWQPRGDFLASQGGPCSSSLLYSVKLVKPGYLIYYYQHRDEGVLFQFQVENDRCQSIDEAHQNRFPTMTSDSEWRKATVELKTGMNILHWKTIGIATEQEERRDNPVLIKKIEIYGVAYTSSCTPCPAGTFSDVGAKFCTECQENYYTLKGSSNCTPCAASEYSGRESGRCYPRLPCAEKDFYEIHTPCDEQKQTQILYKWIEPRICRDDKVKLPPAGKKQTCPPCNPGMQYTNTTGCSFCSMNHFSDGRGLCKPCPPSTMPKYEYKFRTWNNLPDNMASKCMSFEDGCSSDDGWQTVGDYVQSATYHADGAYLILNLDVTGFTNKGGIVNGLPVEVGRITFSFDLQCSSKCEFTFMQGKRNRGVTVIKTWNSTQSKEEFTHPINHNDSYTFTWVFQKLVWDQSSPAASAETRKLIHDVAKIYFIGVTNTVDGGASTCVSCHQGNKREGCIPCPAGHYFESNTSKCTLCPENTYVTNSLAYGKDSCYQCGPGLRSKDRQHCFSDCKITLEEKSFDFSALKGHHSVKGNSLFTVNGTEYYHLFNVSLCGDAITGTTVCRNNGTRRVNLADEGSRIESILCRSTIVPPKTVNDVPLSTQSVSLGDHLLGITSSNKLGSITIPNIFEAEKDPEMGKTLDLNFFYSSPITTQACPNGRSTTITLRCRTSEQGTGSLSLPSACPDGTCDGCNFHLLWHTRHACATCTDKDFEIVKSECTNGQQTMHYIAPKHCLLPSWVTLPDNKTRKCSSIPRELKLIGIVATFLAFALMILLVYFWKKNRKLEYKYMKLVQSSNSKDGELPPAESCAIDDEDEDHFDSMQYRQSKSNILFNKIKAMAGNKNESDNPFETIKLTGKDNYS